jgi:hypothetical protein
MPWQSSTRSARPASGRLARRARSFDPMTNAREAVAKYRDSLRRTATASCRGRPTRATTPDRAPADLRPVPDRRSGPERRGRRGRHQRRRHGCAPSAQAEGDRASTSSRTGSTTSTCRSRPASSRKARATRRSSTRSSGRYRDCTAPTACGRWPHDAKRSSARDRSRTARRRAGRRPPELQDLAAGEDRQPDDRQPVPAGVPRPPGLPRRLRSSHPGRGRTPSRCKRSRGALPGLRSEADKTTALGMIADLTPQPTIPGYDKAQADLALAGLTKTTGDDLAALNTLKGIDTGQLNDAVSKGDYAGIQQWAGELKGVQDSIDNLDGLDRQQQRPAPAAARHREGTQRAARARPGGRSVRGAHARALACEPARHHLRHQGRDEQAPADGRGFAVRGGE